MKERDWGMSPFLFVMKILGAFPYYQTTGAECTSASVEDEKKNQDFNQAQPAPALDNNEKHKNEESEVDHIQDLQEELSTLNQEVACPRYRQSIIWKVWTRVLATMGLINFGLGVWRVSQSVPRGPSQSYIASISFKLDEIQEIITISASLCYIMLKSPSLLRLLRFLHVLLYDIQEDIGKPYHRASLVIPFIVSLTSHVVLITSCIILTGNSNIPAAISETFLLTLSFFLGTVLMLMIEWLVQIISHIHCFLINILSKDMHDPGCIEKNLRNISILQNEVHPLHYNVESYQESRQQTPTFNHNQGLSVICTAEAGAADMTSNVNNTEPVTCLDDIQRVQKKLYLVNKFVQFLSNYFSVPVTLFMLYSVVTGILSLFYCSFFIEMVTLVRVSIAFHVVISLIPLIILSNAPYALEQKVTKRILSRNNFLLRF